jgi:23S rRNA pseudouridine2605 synthase
MVRTASRSLTEMQTRVRINKFLRDCQLGSRRKCESLVDEGLVVVNGEPVTDKGTLVDPDKDIVEVRGKRVLPFREKVYVAAHKPRGVLTTLKDPQGRETIYEAIDNLPAGLFTIGRLDMESEGLVVLTNDGKLAFRLSHPRFGIERIYRVETRGKLKASDVERLKTGIDLENGLARAKRARLLRETEGGSALELTLTEGKKREIRRMIAACGFEVAHLRRIQFGSVSLGDLEAGEWRHLTRDEVRGLRRMVEESYISKLRGSDSEENSDHD